MRKHPLAVCAVNYISPKVSEKEDSLLKTVNYMRDFTNMCAKYLFRQMRSPSLMLR